MPPVKKLPAALILAAALQACATPAWELRRLAENSGFSPHTLHGGGFELEAFFKPGEGTVLHVYLEGDGLPWLRPDRVSPDPTPRNPLMLRLMRADPGPALYLGRPCYNGHAEDPRCSPALWTHRRYGPEVVGAMAEGLAAFLRGHAYAGLAFVGHSGGGALALLLAGRFPATRMALTLACNADIDLWADYHGYSRLQGSLNPAGAPGGGFAEVHYLAGKDEAVPPELFRPVLEKRPGARVAVVPGLDHACCWGSPWPWILKELP